MKRSILFFLFLIPFFGVQAQKTWKSKYDSVSVSPSGELCIVYKKEKCGVAEESSGQLIFKTIYEDAEFLDDGFVMLYIEDERGDIRKGVLDKNGKEIISISFKDVYYLGEGLFSAKQGDNWSLLSNSGKALTPYKYQLMSLAGEGLVKAKLNNKFGFLDTNGQEVIQFNFNEVLSNFYNGMAIVKAGSNHYIITKTAKETPLLFDKVDYFYRGLARVEKTGKFGFINRKGEVVVPCKYSRAEDFYWHRLSNVGSNGKSGYIDTTGAEVIPLKFDYSESFREGLAYVAINYVDGEGNYRTGKYGFIDETGKLVIENKFKIAGDFSEGLAWAYIESKCGFIDKTGKEIIPFTWESAEKFQEGLAPVMVNGKWGFIDKKGKLVIPCSFEKINSGFSAGKAYVKQNDSSFFINTKGEKLKD